jgi:hypothetical protein
MIEYIFLSLWILIFCSIPICAYFDYHLFRNRLKCEKCNYDMIQEAKYYWVLSCTIETLMFLSGISAGMIIMSALK